MGIDDLMPEDDNNETSESSRDNSDEKSLSTSDFVSYSGGSRYLSGERWRQIIEVMENELNISYAELAERSPDEQEQILQKADDFISGMGSWTGTEFDIETRCIVCGHDCHADGIILEGYNVCRGHSAQEVRLAIDNLESANER